MGNERSEGRRLPTESGNSGVEDKVSAVTRNCETGTGAESGKSGGRGAFVSDSLHFPPQLPSNRFPSTRLVVAGCSKCKSGSLLDTHLGGRG